MAQSKSYWCLEGSFGLGSMRNWPCRLAVELLAGPLQQNKYGMPAIATTTYVEGAWRDGRSLPLRS